MSAIQAVYEEGVFRPIQPVDLPESCRVELEFRVHCEPDESPEPLRATPQEIGCGKRVPDLAAPPIEDVIAEIVAAVPPEAWDALPADLTDNLDHYLYGTPKK